MITLPPSLAQAALGGPLTKHPLYEMWRSMRRRCGSANNADYKWYGAKGVQVCERWKLKKGKGFLNFISDMGHRADGMQLDRIDNRKGYSPENCRWATPLQQARNTSRNNKITFKGKTMILQEWANELGMRWDHLSFRLRSGWSVERTLTEPVRSYRK